MARGMTAKVLIDGSYFKMTVLFNTFIEMIELFFSVSVEYIRYVHPEEDPPEHIPTSNERHIDFIACSHKSKIHTNLIKELNQPSGRYNTIIYIGNTQNYYRHFNNDYKYYVCRYKKSDVEDELSKFQTISISGHTVHLDELIYLTRSIYIVHLINDAIYNKVNEPMLHVVLDSIRETIYYNDCGVQCALDLAMKAGYSESIITKLIEKGFKPSHKSLHFADFGNYNESIVNYCSTFTELSHI